jgi:hypothetical protein
MIIPNILPDPEVVKAIGPTFEDELKVAGLLGLPFSWGADGSIAFGEAITPGQEAAVLAVYAAHDPMQVEPPVPLSPQAVMLDAFLADSSPTFAKLKTFLVELRKTL